MFENINFNKPWKKILEIHEGWSKDKKYYIVGKDDSKYLLRIADASLFEKKKKQIDFLSKIKSLNINAQEALAFGWLNENSVYLLFTWVEGEKARKVIPKLSKEKQYKLGVDAGIILKKIHSIPIDTKGMSWWNQYQKKVANKFEMLNRCEIELPNKDIIIKYVFDNMHIVKDREIKIQHGDYHVGNMVVDKGKLGIIDFDKVDLADPYDDFKPFSWNVIISPLFATGLIDGYFDFHIPNDFFPILALYAAESVMGHLPWATRFGDEEIKTAIKISNLIFKWFDGFNKVVPSWYKRP
ncbi:MAG TPA: phosphotransferase [Acholeplasmataceae bacterium]|nr:phosphotransferase [Acholeplasmataceae bacterium]